MKQGIHPKTYQNTKITCACGNSFTSISTRENITVEICSACHPFYTGQQKFVDTEGRIDKFVKKQKIASQKKQTAEDIKTQKEQKKSKVKSANSTGQISLKDMLEKAREQNL